MKGVVWVIMFSISSSDDAVSLTKYSQLSTDGQFTVSH